MSTIPIDLERQFEQRWAARLARQAREATPKKTEHEKRQSEAAVGANQRRLLPEQRADSECPTFARQLAPS
jgi:hypothetical protein